MTAELVVFQALRMASATLDDAPHRRRNASYPEGLENDPKHDVFLNQDTKCHAAPGQVIIAHGTYARCQLGDQP